MKKIEADGTLAQIQKKWEDEAAQVLKKVKKQSGSACDFSSFRTLKWKIARRIHGRHSGKLLHYKTVAAGLDAGHRCRVVDCDSGVCLFGMRNGENELEKETQKSAAYLAEILEQPLWDYDLERMQIIGGIFAKDLRVERLIIRETTGKVIFNYAGSESNSDTVQLTSTITHRDRPLGEVHVEYSRSAYRNQVWQLALTGLAMSVLALLAAYVTVHLLIRALLESPLTRLLPSSIAMQKGITRLKARRSRIWSFSALVPF